MKKIIFAVLVLVLCAAFTMPPALPSSFWGYTSGLPVGAVIEISSDGVVVATAQVLDYGGIIAYAVNVCNGSDGDVLQFKYNNSLVGVGTYATGTNQRLDLVLLVGRLIKRGK